MLKRIAIALLAMMISIVSAVGVHATPAGQLASMTVSASKLEVQTTSHTELLGVLNPQVLAVQYRSALVAEGSTNQVLRKIRVSNPQTLRVNRVKVTIYNVVDGRKAVWQRDVVPVGKWVKIGVVCRGECAITTEVQATTLGRYWDRPHYVAWPGIGE